ncbi:hypothetical protein GCM10025868_13280 [Angustibacter aerolatus]|uniref:Uncharacterized protein n=1 Tax=Angustibacter aerolatus TaxID=1162965 RepID=A0ABQ6JD11_9ACTN|nr:hypothetical protein GCM10025868_13280 [Angustibacter aerolatus]
MLRDVGADLGDRADDLVAGHDREGLRAPVAVHGVDVGVADAGVLDRDEHVVRADLAALDGRGGQGLPGCGGGVGGDAHARWFSLELGFGIVGGNTDPGHRMPRPTVNPR